MAEQNDFSACELHVSEEEYKIHGARKIKGEIDLVQCLACGEWSPITEWKRTEDSHYCEICGEHDGLQCPKCGHDHDYIFAKFNITIKKAMNTNSTTSAVLLADVLIEIAGRVNDLKDDVRSAEAAHDNKAREIAVAMETAKSLRDAHNKISTQFEILKGLSDQQHEVAKDLREQLGHRENERDEAVQRLNDSDEKLFRQKEIYEGAITRLKKALTSEEGKVAKLRAKHSEQNEIIRGYVDTITELRKEIAKLKKA